MSTPNIQAAHHFHNCFRQAIQFQIYDSRTGAIFRGEGKRIKNSPSLSLEVDGMTLTPQYSKRC